MRYLSFIIIFVVTLAVSYGQSPHGAKFDRDCQQCHSIESWKVNSSEMKFNHIETGFELIGQHKTISCTNCHSSLVFAESKTKTACINCHTDIHENTVSQDCARCHDPKTWVIENILDVHRFGRFPLLGNHAKADCKQCHQSSSNLRFNPVGINCFDCHSNNYYSTQNPDHVKANFPKDCQQCHNLTSFSWSATSIVHDFFPLTGAHNIADCFSCHGKDTFKGLSQNCYSCHQKNYEGVTAPNHVALNFAKECNQCHTTTGRWKPATFSNHDLFYPLLGAHNLIRVDCNKCHSTGYSSPQRKCLNCHETNYDSAVNPNHAAAGFSTDCLSCHSQTAWKPSTFDHDGQYFPINSGTHKNEWNVCSDCHNDQTNYKNFECINCHEHNKTSTDSEHGSVSGYTYLSRSCYSCHPSGSKNGAINHSLTNFPLLGAHTTTACNLCHTSGFAGTPTLCYSCHQTNYTSAPNHVSQGYPQTCEQCHTPTAWKPSSFNHATTNFPLLGSHTTVNCSSCHTTGFAGMPTLCYSCHQTNYTTAPNHVSQGYPQTCEQCHTPTAWKPSSFNHASTNFPLLGSHTTVNCSSCHTTGFAGTPTLCYSCHQANYTAAPNHVSQGYPQTCEQCHTPTVWKPSSFNHATTNFPLLGAHTTVNCSSCHTSGFAGVPTLCYSCHQTNYTAAPNHVSQDYPQTCDQCHTPTAWKPSTFNHATTNFPLLGSHTTANCSSCHTSGFAGTPTLCYSCHQTSYTTAPNHVSQGYPQTCELCHTPTAWKPSTFNHATTNFPLLGSHTTVNCSSCHTTGFAGTPTLCYSCHQTNYTSAPNHVSQGYPQTCEQCHTPTAWKPSTFNHAGTNFPLLGSHTTVNCSSCHTSGFAGTPTLCYSCHQSSYTSAPNHVSLGYPQTCDQCHTPTGWKPSSFNHAATTFPLLGSHTTVNCSSCHTSGFAGTPTLCYSCHQANYASAPNHVSQGYPQTCEQCHTPTAWKPSTFNHSTTNFPLLGAHTTVNCSSCHTTGFAGTPTLCYSCHQTNYTSAPNHVSQGYPQTCEQCHTTTTWQGATFNHSATAFPLTGGHISVVCASCHTSGFKGTSTICSSCHQSKYQSTTNPNHISIGIPNTCEQCHTTNPGWKPATFPTHNNYYPILGAHLQIANQCSNCHNGNYTNTPNQCVGCHLGNYNSATNPNHAIAKFPTNCETCHSQNAWTPSTFNHDGQYFPIYSGTHRGKWTLCSECHTNQTNYKVFECINCHEHNKTSTDKDHSNVKNYVYLSTACYTCHPTGRN